MRRFVEQTLPWHQNARHLRNFSASSVFMIRGDLLSNDSLSNALQEISASRGTKACTLLNPGSFPHLNISLNDLAANSWIQWSNLWMVYSTLCNEFRSPRQFICVGATSQPSISNDSFANASGSLRTDVSPFNKPSVNELANTCCCPHIPPKDLSGHFVSNFWRQKDTLL